MAYQLDTQGARALARIPFATGPDFTKFQITGRRVLESVSRVAAGPESALEAQAFLAFINAAWKEGIIVTVGQKMHVAAHVREHAE